MCVLFADDVYIANIVANGVFSFLSTNKINSFNSWYKVSFTATGGMFVCLFDLDNLIYFIEGEDKLVVYTVVISSICNIINKKQYAMSKSSRQPLL